MKNFISFLLFFLCFQMTFGSEFAFASNSFFSTQNQRAKVAGVPGSTIQYKIQVRNLTDKTITLSIDTSILETTLPFQVSLSHSGNMVRNDIDLNKHESKILDVFIKTTEQTPIKTQGILKVLFTLNSQKAIKSEVLLYFYVVKEISMLLKIGSNNVSVKDQDPFVLDYPPYIKDGRTFVPLRFIAESFGATIGWEDKEKKVTYELRGRKLSLWINSKRYLVDGVNKTMDVAPEIKPPGRTFVPIRLISEELGAQVEWNAPNQEVKISYIASS
jgi:hypothetical protein